MLYKISYKNKMTNNSQLLIDTIKHSQELLDITLSSNYDIQQFSLYYTTLTQIQKILQTNIDFLNETSSLSDLNQLLIEFKESFDIFFNFQNQDQSISLLQSAFLHVEFSIISHNFTDQKQDSQCFKHILLLFGNLFGNNQIDFTLFKTIFSQFFLIDQTIFDQISCQKVKISLSDANYLKSIILHSIDQNLTIPYDQLLLNTKITQTKAISSIKTKFNTITELNLLSIQLPQTSILTPHQPPKLQTNPLPAYQTLSSDQLPLLDNGVLTPLQLTEQPVNLFKKLVGTPVFPSSFTNLSPIFALILQSENGRNQESFFDFTNITPSNSALKTANAANFITMRFIQREAVKTFSNAVKNNQNKQSGSKMIKKILQTKDKFIELILSNLGGQHRKEMKQQLFKNAELENENFEFSNEDDEIFKFLGLCVHQLVGIGVSGGVMGQNQLIVQIFQIYEPFGGIGSQNMYQYMNVLITEFNQFDSLVLAFKAAQRAILELISIKITPDSAVINKIRGVNSSSKKSFIAPLTCVKPAEITEMYQLYANFYKNIEIDLNFQFSLLINEAQLIQKVFAFCEVSACQKQQNLGVNCQILPEFAKFSSGKINGNGEILTISFTNSGCSTLIQHLTLGQFMRPATIFEVLSTEDQVYKLENLIPDQVQKSQKALKIVQNDDDVVSVGSWLSMDSQNFQDEVEQSVEKENLALLQFNKNIKNVEFTSKESEQHIEKCDFDAFSDQKFTLNQTFKYVQIDLMEPFQPQETKQRRLVPPVKFVKLNQPKTTFAVKKSINLLPFMNSSELAFIDAPLKNFNIQNQNFSQVEKGKFLEQRNLVTGEIKELLAKLQGITSNSQQFTKQLQMVLQKSTLAANLKQPQVALFQPKMTEIQCQKMYNLMKSQMSQSHQEGETAQKTISDYKIQFDQLQLAGQITPELTEKFNSSVQQFQNQVNYYFGVEKFISQEADLVQQIICNASLENQLINEIEQKRTVLSQFESEIAKIEKIENDASKYQQLAEKAQFIMFVYDCTGSEKQIISDEIVNFLQGKQGFVVANKADLYEKFGNDNLVQKNVQVSKKLGWEHFAVSSLDGSFMTILRAGICDKIGVQYNGRMYAGDVLNAAKK